MSRVLVVDDDSGMRAALEARFIRRGWRVDTAASAREAMEKFRRGMHPLIVTDIRMPGEDGFFIMREAQAMTTHTAVILLTAYANIPEAVAAMKNGACDYVPKQMSSTSLEITHIRADLISKIRAASQHRSTQPRPAWAQTAPFCQISNSGLQGGSRDRRHRDFDRRP
jgi:DNA-binding NtrC family response regulator